MPIAITGKLQASAGKGAFKLTWPEEFDAGNVDVVVQTIAGGAFKGGSHATAPVGEIVTQVKTSAGAPTHAASEGTLCWNSVDDVLYVNNDGTTAWTAIALATKNKTVARILYIENPTATDEIPIAYVPDAATMVAVRAVTDVGAVDFNIERRAKLTPDVAGGNTWSSDKTAIAAGLEQTTFDNAEIPADYWLHYSASAVASSPTKLWISLEYTVN